MAVLGNVKKLVVVEHLHEVIARGRGDDGGGDELVHCFVVLGVGGVVD